MYASMFIEDLLPSRLCTRCHDIFEARGHSLLHLIAFDRISSSVRHGDPTLSVPLNKV